MYFAINTGKKKGVLEYRQPIDFIRVFSFTAFDLMGIDLAVALQYLTHTFKSPNWNGNVIATFMNLNKIQRGYFLFFPLFFSSFLIQSQIAAISSDQEK